MGSSKKLIYLVHLSCWLFFFSMIVFFVYQTADLRMAGLASGNWRIWVFFIVFPTIFYLNLGWMFPALFLRKNYVVYFTGLILLFVGVYYLEPFEKLIQLKNDPRRFTEFSAGINPDNPLPPFPRDGIERQHEAGHGLRGGPGRRPGIDIMSVTLFILSWSVSTGLGFFRQWRNTEQRALKAEAERANAELSFLKAQVNPHFLFNTLNNIYSMAVTGNPATAESVLKLSNIMRYITDEGRENFVSLSDEIDCLQDYIDLQRIRLGELTRVEFVVNGDAGVHAVPPLLLMSFVENAFKYGTSNHENAVINIWISIDDRDIHFTCMNKIFRAETKTDGTGIGIGNTKQRLLSLYPGKHDLKITENNELFIAEVKLSAS